MFWQKDVDELIEEWTLEHDKDDGEWPSYVASSPAELCFKWLIEQGKGVIPDSRIDEKAGEGNPCNPVTVEHPGFFKGLPLFALIYFSR